MIQLVNVLVAIDKAHTAPQRTLNCGLGLDGLNNTAQHIEYNSQNM